ncbi:MAG: hypothetical protein ACFFFH_02955 [Candidatus Thorarchaeota archaeon]
MNILRKDNQAITFIGIILLGVLLPCPVSLSSVIVSSKLEEIKYPLVDSNVTVNNITIKQALVQDVTKMRLNEIKYETQEHRVEWAGDEYIELLVLEGGFDPSYWYVTDWDDDNYWEIPASCPTVSPNEFIVIHIGIGTNDNDGPIYHYYMNEYIESLDDQGESITLFEDNDSEHNREEDTAHDFVAYGSFSERESIGNAWCGWPNNGNTTTHSIEWKGNRYESLQLFGEDLDNSSNWYPANSTLGRENILLNCYIEDFTGFESEVYCNVTATNASGWGSGRIKIAESIGSPSIAQSVCCFTSTGVIHNITLYTNQTVFPNTSIHFQISTNSNKWEPISPNQTYSLEKAYHTLFWRARLEIEDPEKPSPWIDSIRIEFDIFYDTKPPIIKIINLQNNSVIFPGTIIECTIEDFCNVKSWITWDEGPELTLTNPWMIICPFLEEGYHWLTISANDTLGYQSRKNYLLFVNQPPRINLLTNTSIITLKTDIAFSIADHSLVEVWYQWDNLTKTTITSPFLVRAIDSPGEHTLIIGAWDSWDNTTIKIFTFIILNPATIDTSLLPSNIYTQESFKYSLTIVNSEEISLNLTLLAFSPVDDVLQGNGSQILLDHGEEQSLTLEIRPMQTGRHQVTIYLLYEDFEYYYEALELIVWPQWLSPNYLLEFRIFLFLVLSVVVCSSGSIYYTRKYIVTSRQFWKLRDQLNHLVDQLTLSNLEIIVVKEKKSSKKHSSKLLGFPQNLLIIEPLDREALQNQFYSLRDEIISSELRNHRELSKLLTQAEELLNENFENVKM